MTDDEVAHRRLLQTALDVIREIERRQAAGREWHEPDPDERAISRFNADIEKLRSGIAKLYPETAQVTSFDFCTFLDGTIPCLGGQPQEKPQRRAEVFLETLLTPLKHAVKDWLCIVPVLNLRLRGGDHRCGARRLGEFHLYPELKSPGLARRARRFRALLSSHGVTVRDSSYEFGTFLFRHMDRKFGGGLSELPLLVFKIRGSDSSWLQAPRHLAALQAGLETHVPAYGPTSLPDFSRPRLVFTSSADPTPEQPSARHFLFVDESTGWFSMMPLSTETTLPSCGLPLRGELQTRVDRVVRLLTHHHDEDNDSLRSRMRRMATMLLHAESATESFVKLLLLVIGLECIISSDDTAEIQHRLADHVSALLARDADDYAKLCKLVRELYQQRSDIVHRADTSVAGDRRKLGDPPPRDVFVDRVAVRQARWLLCGCIQALAAAHVALSKEHAPGEIEIAFRAAIDRARFAGPKALPWRGS